MKLNEKISKRRRARLQRKLEKIEYLLQHTTEERKAEKDIRKAARRIKRLQKLRGFKPFDLKCVRWYEKRQFEKANGDTKVILKDVVPSGDFNSATA